MSKVVNMVGGGSSGTPRKYLVKDGVAVNVSLVALGMKSSSSSAFSATAPPISYGQGLVSLGFPSSGTDGAGIVYFDTAVDLSQYSKLYLSGRWQLYTTSSFSQSNLSYNLWTSIGTYQNENRLVQVPASGLFTTSGGDFNSAAKLDTTSILLLDITSLASRPSAFVGFNFARASYGSSHTNADLFDIWLE